MIRPVFRRAVLPLALALLIVVRPTPATPLGSPAQPPAVDLDVCVIVPRLSEQQSITRVPLTRPTLFVAGPLLEVRIERGGRQAWKLVAPGGELLHGPIAWPLAPIRPEERLVLLLRPPGAPPEAFATVPLQGAGAAELQRNDQLLNRLGQDPQAWLQAVLQARDRGDLALALALLFAFEGPSSRNLDSLRLEVFQRGCGSAGSGDSLRQRSLPVRTVVQGSSRGRLPLPG